MSKVLKLDPKAPIPSKAGGRVFATLWTFERTALMCLLVQCELYIEALQTNGALKGLFPCESLCASPYQKTRMCSTLKKTLIPIGTFCNLS
ncbi:hypothetical protein CEXT_113341 [Caerostris extrusa]|uniref:Uncharacterized protein n=1 Tax=Caerostris extrusa TaxID=172846 RepID=A0AAV4MB03_CAEEX|nr:hypothetical protein CEXT_113341 [Caerostris extrusa]